jgi:hypothetical protein
LRSKYAEFNDYHFVDRSRLLETNFALQSTQALSKPSRKIHRMIQLAQESHREKYETEILTLKEQLKHLPKFPHGNRKVARTANQPGLEALVQRDISAAVKFFLTAYRADPADVEILNNLGYAQVLADLPQAEDTLVNLLKIAELPGLGSVPWNWIGLKPSCCVNQRSFTRFAKK